MYVGGHFEALKLAANIGTLAVGVVSALTYYMCWRRSEVARARRMAERGRAGFSSLPSPVPVLPRWLGLIGGHTLQMKMDKVTSRLYQVSLCYGNIGTCSCTRSRFSSTAISSLVDFVDLIQRNTCGDFTVIPISVCPDV